MDVEVAEFCSQLGYDVAGFAEEIYADAYICIPPLFRYQTETCGVITGRVLSVNTKNISYDEDNLPTDHYVVHFVLEQEQTKIQIPCAYGKGYPVFFMLPEKQKTLVD